MHSNNTSRLLVRGAAIVLLLYPLLFAAAFILHFDSWQDFFDFKLIYEQRTAAEFMTTLTGDNADRLFLIPHYTGYLALPFMIGTGLLIGRLLYRTKPLLSLVGSSMVVVGAVFLSGVFASWLSFSAVANVPETLRAEGIILLKELTTMQGPLLFSTVMSVLSLAGMVLLGIGLFNSRIISKWSAAMFTLGHILIITFMDLDNWMLIGAAMMLLGVLPLSIKLFHSSVKAKKEDVFGMDLSVT